MLELRLEDGVRGAPGDVDGKHRVVLPVSVAVVGVDRLPVVAFAAEGRLAGGDERYSPHLPGGGWAPSRVVQRLFEVVGEA